MNTLFKKLCQVEVALSELLSPFEKTSKGVQLFYKGGKGGCSESSQNSLQNAGILRAPPLLQLRIKAALKFPTRDFWVSFRRKSVLRRIYRPSPFGSYRAPQLASGKQTRHPGKLGHPKRLKFRQRTNFFGGKKMAFKGV